MTRPWGLEQQSSAYWEDKYWEIVRKTYLNQQPYEIKQLRQQITCLVDLTEHLTDVNTCWHIVGETVYLDATKLKQLILERHHERSREETRPFKRLAISESKYFKG